MSVIVKSGGGENVKPEVLTYEQLLETAITNLQGKAFVPPVKEGEHVWKKYVSILPEGYTQLAYIQSSGTQYIDTGFYPNQDTSIEIDVEVTDTSATGWLFCGRTAASDSAFGMYSYVSTGKLYFVYGAKSVTFSDAKVLTRQVCVVEKNKATVDDETVTTTEQTFTSSATLCLLARNTAGTVATNTCAKLYSCKVYDNGVLIRDYKPCKKADGEIGLYDIENGVFYGNNGTGSFDSGEIVGEFIGYVVADDTNAYPTDGEQDGYYYIKYDPTVNIPENIRENINNWGVLGTMVEGVSGIDYGEVTLTSNQSSLVIEHSLGVVPSQCILYRKANPFTVVGITSAVINDEVLVGTSTTRISIVTETLSKTNTTVTFKAYSSAEPFYTGSTYVWIVIA